MKIKKPLTLLLIITLSMLVLTACGSSKCKEQDCDEEATDGDYCSYHATLKTVDDAAKDIFNEFVG